MTDYDITESVVAVLPRNCVARLNPDHAWSVLCQERATAECFTVAGKWEPLCDRHGERYVGTDRIRPLGASQRQQPGTTAVSSTEDNAHPGGES